VLVPEDAVRSTWDDDPCIGASYATALNGRPHQTVELIRAVGPLHFAGEHIAEQSGQNRNIAIL
jgi:hypothetical protein